jgi:hypothetical protein
MADIIEIMKMNELKIQYKLMNIRLLQIRKEITKNQKYNRSCYKSDNIKHMLLTKPKLDTDAF